jgi:dihydroorotate dehydrogenase (fumarate)
MPGASPLVDHIHTVLRLEEAGASAIVLNSLFEEDIARYGFEPDRYLERLLRIKQRTGVPIIASLNGTSSELPLRLRWIAILYGRVRASLALTGGVHDAIDAVKAVMAGADAVQIVSALIESGPARLKTIRTEFARWAEAHQYESVCAMRGRVSLARAPNPAAFERGNYMQMLQQWKGVES